MDWSDILQLKSWTPFSQLQHEACPVAEGLFRIGEHAFVLTQEVNRLLEENDPEAPFVTRAYWAASSQALLRLHGGETAVLGEQPPAIRPPPELLLGTGSRYGDILREGISRHIDCSERAIYSKQGEFLYRLISCGRFQYCFLGNRDDQDEEPFLVEIKLLK